MGDKLDPHHLVALMSNVFNKHQDGSSRSLDYTSINPEYGITDERETSFLTIPVLDAIASTCVWRKKSQVVAIGLQLNHEEQKIRLTIAENQDVPKSMSLYLESVWERLQALSDKLLLKEGSDEDEAGLSDVPDEMFLPLRVDISKNGSCV